jgi:hypothetical protein
VRAWGLERVRGASRAALLAVLVLASPLHAQECASAEAEALRAHLAEQAVSVRRWNDVWRITFATVTLGAVVLAIENPFPELRDNLWVTAGKSALATASRLFLPLRVEVPPPQADVCAEIAALRASIETTARQERRLLWMHHAGSVLLNAAGAVILLLRGNTVSESLVTAGVGYAVGLVATYTMPRATWRYWREQTWSAAYVPQNGGGIVAFGMTF